MGARVAVAGASGYAGGELLRLLAAHPDLELGTVTADSNAGRPITDLHPHLAGVAALAGRSFDADADDADSAQRMSACDLVFLALPPGQSSRQAEHIPASVKIVDLGPDFRLADPLAWTRHYGSPHPGRWTCGLPELPGARRQIRAAARVAVPGCYATAAILALTPLLTAGLVEPDDVVVVAASGTSGAGRVPKPSLLASEVMGAVSAYQTGGAHRHTPEIEQAIDEAVDRSPGRGGQRARVCFTPVLAPMPRGILATCTARLAPPGGTGGAAKAPEARDAGSVAEAGSAAEAGTAGETATARLRAALTQAYAAEPFVCVLPPGHWPSTAAVAGSNAVHVQAAADPRAGRAVVVTAIDNLGKGAAGQAIQNANLMLGLAETAGLSACGVAP